MLTQDSVSVLKQNFVELNGETQQVGQNIRNTYMNSSSGRAVIAGTLPEVYLNAVLAVWGDTPTIQDTTPENKTDQQ